MKKLKYLLFLFITLICVTGCGKDNSKENLKEAMLKLKDTKAIAMKMSVTMGSDEMKLPLNFEISVNENGMHMKYSTNLFGMEVAEETYAINKGEESFVYTYDSEDKKWYYMRGEKGNSVIDFNFDDNADFEKELDEYLESLSSIKKVKSDKDGYDKLEITISKKTMEESINKEKDIEEDDKKDIEEALKSLPEEFTFYMYLKNGELAIINMDLSSMTIPSLTEEMPEGVNMKLYDLTLEILGRNENVLVEVPKEIEDSATEYKLDLDDLDLGGKEKM